MALGEDAYSAALFEIEIDDIVIAQFKEASGLSIEISVIEHLENKPGGIPVLKKLPATQKFGDITLKRGLTKSEDFWAWMQAVQEGKIYESRRNATIRMFDYDHGVGSRWELMYCWPSKLTLGSLQAGGTDVAVEEVTLTHEGVKFVKAS